MHLLLMHRDRCWLYVRCIKSVIMKSDQSYFINTCRDNINQRHGPVMTQPLILLHSSSSAHSVIAARAPPDPSVSECQCAERVCRPWAESWSSGLQSPQTKILYGNKRTFIMQLLWTLTEPISLMLLRLYTFMIRRPWNVPIYGAGFRGTG